jgi:hypothetical protein
MSKDLRYPIGTYDYPTTVSEYERERWMQDISIAPRLLEDAVDGLSDRQMETAYRPGGWTVRQVVHHVADSHMNGLIRFKLALTEEQPTIKCYDEARWAELADVSVVPIEVSLALLDGIHTRWMAVLRSLKSEDFRRSFFHPERNGVLTLEQALGLYAWHGRHHAAHITTLRDREGWE